eukprot:UN05128
MDEQIEKLQALSEKPKFDANDKASMETMITVLNLANKQLAEVAKQWHKLVLYFTELDIKVTTMNMNITAGVQIGKRRIELSNYKSKLLRKQYVGSLSSGKTISLSIKQFTKLYMEASTSVIMPLAGEATAALGLSKNR